MNFEIESGLMKRLPMILGILFFLAGITYGQDNAKDVNSVDAIITSLYESISGEAGERDWDRFRSLFAEDAHLIPSRKNQEGVLGYRAWSPQDYIDNVNQYFMENPFFEVEIFRVTDEYGPVTHIFSTYESRRAENEEPFSRGINSIQLFNDDNRWWILNIFWYGETEDVPLPAKYLPGN